MAYFSNSTEGGILEDQCEDCPLGRGWKDESPGQGQLFSPDELPERPLRPCPVALVQLTHNYGQIRPPEADEAANYLERIQHEVDGKADRKREHLPPEFDTGPTRLGRLSPAVNWLRSDDFADAMNLLIDPAGTCLVRQQLQEHCGPQ